MHNPRLGERVNIVNEWNVYSSPITPIIIPSYPRPWDYAIPILWKLIPFLRFWDLNLVRINVFIDFLSRIPTTYIYKNMLEHCCRPWTLLWQSGYDFMARRLYFPMKAVLKEKLRCKWRMSSAIYRCRCKRRSGAWLGMIGLGWE